MSNCPGTVTLTYNGEIYNHAELRKELQALGKYQWKTDHSDTEVLLHAYEEWGVDCVKKFYGMFAVAIYDDRDPQKPVLHLIRDRVGVKLYLSPHPVGRVALRV
jgi:asparagine synthase (glutamine-hydrolysing)